MVRDTYLDIEEFFCEHWRSVIDWVAGSIEGSTKHFNTHWHSEYITSKLTSSGDVINTRCSFENLKKMSSLVIRTSLLFMMGHLPVRQPAFP